MRRVSRRSFMARVAGSALLAGGAAALILGTAEAQRRVRSDRDATDPTHRGVPRNDAMSDNDGPPEQDSGNGAPRGKPLADADMTDPVAVGRGYQNCNDADDGPKADERGLGRTCTTQLPQRPTGQTDTDRGPKGDRANYGRAPAHT